jgi:hypothetical protein
MQDLCLSRLQSGKKIFLFNQGGYTKEESKGEGDCRTHDKKTSWE